MKRVDIDNLERLIGQVDGLRKELGVLAKKSPNDAVNEFKLKYINQVLAVTNNFLGKKYIPLESFSLFELDSAPTNSDVTFVLAQYEEALDLKRSDNIQPNLGGWYYIVDDDPALKIRTSPPASISRKNRS